MQWKAYWYGRTNKRNSFHGDRAENITYIASNDPTWCNDSVIVSHGFIWSHCPDSFALPKHPVLSLQSRNRIRVPDRPQVTLQADHSPHWRHECCDRHRGNPVHKKCELVSARHNRCLMWFRNWPTEWVWLSVFNGGSWRHSAYTSMPIDKLILQVDRWRACWERQNFCLTWNNVRLCLSGQCTEWWVWAVVN